jgi:DNA-binding MarR family transcriptional regulator
MSIKLTEAKVESLIDTLNALICEEQLLTREQRENMVRTVATLDGLGERVRLTQAQKEAFRQARAEKPAKKPREPDPVFPRSGSKWSEEDLELIHSIIDDIPDAEIDNHVIFLSGQQQRTPYAIAQRIVAEGRLDKEWAEKWRTTAMKIREQTAQQGDIQPE